MTEDLGSLADEASPKVRSRASTAPTDRSSPSAPSTASSVASTGHSTSIVALSVSSSTSGSPIATLSPTCFNHRRTLTISIVALSLGTRKSIGRLSEQRLDRRRDPLRRWNKRILEVRAIWERMVGQRDSRRRRVEIVEGLTDDVRYDIRAPAACRRLLPDSDKDVGASYAVAYRRDVHRPQHLDIDHFRLDADARPNSS